MNNVNENEQWLLSGDCGKCRRKNYCSKPCTRHKNKVRATMRHMVAATMNEMTGGAMTEIIEKTVHNSFI